MTCYTIDTFGHIRPIGLAAEIYILLTSTHQHYRYKDRKLRFSSYWVCTDRVPKQNPHAGHQLHITAARALHGCCVIPNLRNPF